MSRDDDFFNDDDFSFDDDLRSDFGDDDDFFNDDDFSDFDEPAASADNNEFGFDDDEFDEIEDIDFDEEDDDFFDDEDLEEESGPSGVFLFLAGIMIILLIAAIGLVLFLALTGEDEITPFESTSTAIAQANETTQAQIVAGETEAAISGETETAVAAVSIAETDTAATEQAISAQATETAEAFNLNATETQSVLDITSTAEAEEVSGIQQTQTAVAAQLTADAQVVVPPEETEEPVPTEPGAGVGGPSDIDATATALREVFLSLTPGEGEFGTGGEATATPERPGAVPTALPDTGLFDGDSSNGGLGVIALLAFGLVGMIFGARTLRAANNRQQI
jgi:cytoskeletal protein RodZ